MAAVGGGVDQHIVGPGLHAALDDRLEELVLDLKILKGQVIDKQNEFTVALFDQGDHVRQGAELVLVQLNEPQPTGVKFMEQRPDAG